MRSPRNTATTPARSAFARGRLVGAASIGFAVLVVIENVLFAVTGAPGYGDPIEEVLAYYAKGSPPGSSGCSRPACASSGRDRNEGGAEVAHAGEYSVEGRLLVPGASPVGAATMRAAVQHRYGPPSVLESLALRLATQRIQRPSVQATINADATAEAVGHLLAVQAQDYPLAVCRRHRAAVRPAGRCGGARVRRVGRAVRELSRTAGDLGLVRRDRRLNV